MSRQALIVYGGWDGHQPGQVAELFARVLTEDGFAVVLADSLDAFLQIPVMPDLSLIVPHWTMGKITAEQARPVLEAVRNGVGLAGVHGGMCDAFRENTDWHWMTGGQWVAHPGNDGTRYAIRLGPTRGELTDGIPDEFPVATEQYYMHVDPAVRVWATTRFPVADGPHAPNGPVDMPVIWTKLYGQGRVYYNALGHQADVLAAEPVLTLLRRGFRWAAQRGPA